MNESLFKNLDRRNDPLWIAKEFFNSFNNILFPSTMQYLIEGTGYASEYNGCEFPSDLDEDDEPFEGVRFRYDDDEIVVTEEAFRKCLIAACERYREMNPARSDEIDQLLSEL